MHEDLTRTAEAVSVASSSGPRTGSWGVGAGTFMGHPSMFLSVPDEQGFCFTQAFQAVGLSLNTAIGPRCPGRTGCRCPRSATAGR